VQDAQMTHGGTGTRPGTEYRFDGRVAVVTGAGRGIGRAYARLLAERGATVVVNDLGASTGGSGSDEAPAAETVSEISAAGGEAVADTSDVASPSGAEALVGTALERFGRIDALVNNAGIIRWAGMPDVDEDNLTRHLAVHVGGSFNTIRAAWPHMVDEGYGRIVNTTSAGLFGLPDNTSYAAAKGAVVGLTRSTAVAGADHGITVNCIAPGAMTRMAGRASDETDTRMSPELVAPMVALLAHEECPVSGEIYAAGFGRFARIFIGMAPGYVHTGSTPTVEDVAGQWAAINDEPGYSIPADLPDWSATFMSHLRPDGDG
jgi:NAD(P)-dependent dehydrogenase (short-subunit alcohol dehydrogenase family)